MFNKQSFKATYLLVIGLFLIGSLLSGCGKSNSSGASESPGSSASAPASSAANPPASESGGTKKVSLKVWGGVPAENGPQDAVDNWNKDHPDIHVEYVRYVNDDTGNLKLDTALLSNTDAPDVFITYGDARMTKRVQAGNAEPLNDLIAKSGLDLDGVIGKANMRTFPDGNYYYLPGVRGYGAVMFNQSALDEIGAKLPTADWTWDDFKDLAIKLTKGDRKGTFLDPQLSWFGDTVLQSAKPVDWSIKDDGTSNFDSDAMKYGLELQKSLEDAGAMVKYSEAIASKLTTQDQFLNGKAAMVPTSLYMVRYIKDRKNFPHDFKVTFAPYPQFQKGSNTNPGGGLADLIAINKNSPNKEAAMEFINWYLTGGNMTMVAGGRMPSSMQADGAEMASLVIGEDTDLIDKDTFQQLVTGSYTFPSAYNVPVPAQLNQIFRDEMEKYLLNVQNIDQTLQSMTAQADAAIQKGGK